jgi:hypothetical protein
MKRILLAMVSAFVSNTMLSLLLLRLGLKPPFLINVLIGMVIYFFWFWWFAPKTEDNTPSGT